jgi:hypothetical protein
MAFTVELALFEVTIRAFAAIFVAAMLTAREFLYDERETKE